MRVVDGTTSTVTRLDRSMGREAAAWAVHLYTALGLVCALMTLLAAERRDARVAMLWLMAALIVDSTDGMLARLARVKQVLPQFDGRKLDDITDYANYVLVPVYLLYRFELVDPSWIWVLALPLIASGYGFCNEAAKTDDGYFTGFPSYWNVVFLYAYFIRIPPAALAVVVVLLSLLVFYPVKYLYPSHTRRWMALTMTLNAGWLAAILLLIQEPDRPAPLLLYASLAYPAYYVLLSFYLHWSRRPAQA